MAGENRALVDDVQSLKRHLDMKGKEQNILQMQIRGLQEDNERIARMYQLVQSVASNKKFDEEAGVPAGGNYLERKRADEKE